MSSYFHVIALEFRYMKITDLYSKLKVATRVLIANIKRLSNRTQSNPIYYLLIITSYYLLSIISLFNIQYQNQSFLTREANNTRMEKSSYYKTHIQKKSTI